ncbi:MAG: hypothetical protein ACLQVY_09200 [Limisphaerales bacterium]
MTTTKQVPSCNLAKEVVENIERIVNKSTDDTAVSVARSFERFEERVDAMEARLYSRVSDVEDNVEEAKALIKESTTPLQTAGSPA